VSTPAIVLWLVFGIMVGVSAGWAWAFWMLWHAGDKDDDK